jgi:ABC-2 type transport system permease protein
MTSTTSETGYAHAASQQRERTRREPTARSVTLAGVFRSELIKLRSVVSTTAALLTAAVATIGIPAIAAVAIIAGGSSDDDMSGAIADPTGGSLSGVGAAVFAVLTLGVLAVSNEYSTGTIRPSLAAVPRRSQLVWGKALALLSITLPVGVASAFVAFFVAQLILSSAGHSISLTEPGVARAVLGAGLYLSVAAVLANGFAWMLRSTAGSLAVVVGVLFVLPTIGMLLPARVAAHVVPFLPNNAGMAIMQTTPSGHPAPWLGIAVFAGYAAITLAAASYVANRRDS